MAGHTFFGKQRLCYTEVTDFTDFQGIGSDPMYKRYDSVFSVITRAVPEDVRNFLATPEYISDTDQICWHIPQWTEQPVRLSELEGYEFDRYKCIFDDTVNKFRQGAMDLDGEDLEIMAHAIKYVDFERAYCADGKVYVVAWGMTPDTKQHKVIGSVIHELDFIKKFRVTFESGEHGVLESKIDHSINRVEGTILTESDIPKILPFEGWKFEGWNQNPVGQTVTSDMTFTARYSGAPIEPLVEEPESPVVPLQYLCRFDPGDHGVINGQSEFMLNANTVLDSGIIPNVMANKGYEFRGWNVSPLNCLIDQDRVFTAQYSKCLPWYKRFWLWLVGLFTAKGCLKWLLVLLLIALGLGLLFFLLRGCGGCSNIINPFNGNDEVNGVVPIDTRDTGNGHEIDDNGVICPITGEDGKLPTGDGVVAPVLDEDGTVVPIEKRDLGPDVIANRLILFLEDSNDDVDDLAKDFKAKYPDENYSIIGFDREVGMLVIQIPEDERNTMRESLNKEIPNHRFLVFDEELYQGNSIPDGNTKYEAGWHIKAVRLVEGWAITKGSPDVKIAVVDDGIDAGHPMFKGRIVDAYNVFTQNNKLSIGTGHGTHTAGLAAGSADFLSKGAAGVAPNCMIMPVQVFDNNVCPLSAWVAGVMYSIRHDADVVNISITPRYDGLNQLPVTDQEKVAKTMFKELEKLWDHVAKLAAKKKCILVFAAGNYDILSSITPANRTESTISVTAVDPRRYPTDFTNYGPCSDISAPGVGIYSSVPGGKLDFMEGTSMSAPIVTGTVALMKSLKKDLSVKQAKNVLYKTGADVYGYIPPMVQVDKALQAVKNKDFSTPPIRETIPVPDVNQPEAPDVVVVEEENSEGDRKRVTEQKPNNPNPSPEPDIDEDEIRRQIREHKQQIIQLTQLLKNRGR